MPLLTARLEIEAPDRGTWVALLEGHVGAAIPGYPTLGDVMTARMVADGHLEPGEWGPWQLRERASGLLIGGVGFKGPPNHHGSAVSVERPVAHSVVEISFGLAPQARGRGYATEAVTALVEHAHACGVHAVLAECAIDNADSMGVLRRTRFAEVGRDVSVIWWEHLHGHVPVTRE